MVADLANVDSEAVSLRRHELTLGLKEIDQLCSRHALRRASAEPLIGAELGDYGLDELPSGGIGVALHHVEDIVSVCHNVNKKMAECVLMKKSPNSNLLSD